ncbi:zinc-binding dehydrogenase [Shewanella sp. 202IG2-18]|uniref:alcohol dehydrogenase catalytic domain-containing protein n=1 Tax=Parashewanella hymeniacidonis TaxID=2807618 RepID=UPI0019611C45|nr:zinc-binding dehydrogenase [Parashewanella hymeniacidonis]MBM7070850.1 zinc-binding dehydrogenase [Parashewanella hymeniacidonis]
MKAIVYQKKSDEFTLKNLPIPTIETEYDVVVKVLAAGLNPVDAKINFWHGMVEDMDDDFVPGLDVAGEITQVGSSVTEWKVGDRVLYHGDMRRKHGAFAEYAVHDSRTLVEHPIVAPEVAAATPCAGWTAMHALVDKLHIDIRKSFLLTGGSGGVGGFALQLASHFCVDNIITTCSSKNHEYALSLGADHTVDYRNDVLEKVLELTDGKGVHASMDCVGGDNDILCANALDYEGHMLELVSTIRPSEYNDSFGRGLSFHQVSLGSGHTHGDKGRKSILKSGRRFTHLVNTGRIQVPQLKIISVEDAPAALKQLREKRTVGKIVVKF